MDPEEEDDGFGNECEEDVECDPDQFENGFDIETECPGMELGLESKKLLTEDLNMAEAMLGDDSLVRYSGFLVILTLPIASMNPLTRSAIGLVGEDPVTIVVDITRGYGATAPKPLVVVRHGERECASDRMNTGFLIGVMLSNVMIHFLAERWELSQRRGALLLDMYKLVESRLQNCGNHCILCDKPLEVSGLKPTICGREFCMHQHTALGIGADLSVVDSEPEVSDLLVSMAVAAAGSGPRKEHAMPVLPQDMTHEKIVEALAALQHIRCLTPEASPVVKWVFSSNRAHIVLAAPEERLAKMRTELQFRIHTSTREHQKVFDELRSKHGSFFAFHGSSFCNWHRIIRDNLIVASDTPMMSTGAVHGPGVYLSNLSSMSATYCRMGSTHRWQNSMFGNDPTVLAVCEVANSPTVQRHPMSNIIVASDASCVNLRYLLVYNQNQSGIPNVDADDLGLKRYRNDTTIIGMESVTLIPKQHLLVTSDDYAWDITELVVLIENGHGLFVNQYTKQGFCPSDVQLIIGHPSGLGKKLALIEKANSMLRSRISPKTYRRLLKTGHACKHDNSKEFKEGMTEIARLREYINTLGKRERKALELAPFNCVDSHTRQPFRTTVMHEIGLVSSEAACIHRFGDFLCQTML